MREICDDRGRRWRVESISHGRTSDYLNPRVHRPILQFSCLDARRPHRYVPLPKEHESLADVPHEQLADLLARARVH